MNEIENKQIKYLKKIISEISYNPERFNLYVGEDKFIFGIISPNGHEAPFSKLMQYKTLYDTLMYLDWKIKFSFKKSIKYVYSKQVQRNLNIFHRNSKEENLAYYYIENALFRTSSLWDILAQLYLLFYQIKIKDNKTKNEVIIPQDKVYYKKIFNPKLSYSKNFKDKAIEINEYINEKDDIHINGAWKGNHKYINDCRNKMTHRNSPNFTVMSDYDFNFKKYRPTLLKRTIEDYAIVSKYIEEILNKIEKTLESKSFITLNNKIPIHMIITYVLSYKRAEKNLDFLHRVQKFLYKIFNRWSDKKSYCWYGYIELIKYYPIAKSKIYFNCKCYYEEPYVGKPHIWIL